MIFHPVAHDRTARAVERQIETLVLEGVLRAGERLPGERDLARALDVSRPIVREALAALEQRRLLTSRHGGGTFVADVTGTVFAAPVASLIANDAKARADYLEYRREIEGLTARLAAERATAADRALLEATLDEMRQAHRDADAEREATLDVEFHSAVGECAHNIVLLHTLRACYRLLSDDVFFNRALLYRRDGMRDRLLEQHEAIHAAIMRGDAIGAERAAHQHIDFIERETKAMERDGERTAIAKIRLEQRTGSSGTPARRRSGAQA